MLVPEQVLSFVQVSSLINDRTNVQEVDPESNWTTPLISYLRTSVLPDGKDATRKLKVQASHFVLIKDVLYKRGFSRPFLRCLRHEKADRLRNERSPRGYLRKPLGGTIISTQIDLSRILLAYNAEGRTSLCQGLRQVSKVQ